MGLSFLLVTWQSQRFLEMILVRSGGKSWSTLDEPIEILCQIAIGIMIRLIYQNPSLPIPEANIAKFPWIWFPCIEEFESVISCGFLPALITGCTVKKAYASLGASCHNAYTTFNDKNIPFEDKIYKLSAQNLVYTLWQEGPKLVYAFLTLEPEWSSLSDRIRMNNKVRIKNIYYNLGTWGWNKL